MKLYKEITGKEASEDDIKNAGSEIAAPSPGVNTGRPEISATDTAIMKMKSLTENKGACEKVDKTLQTITLSFFTRLKVSWPLQLLDLQQVKVEKRLRDLLSS